MFHGVVHNGTLIMHDKIVPHDAPSSNTSEAPMTHDPISMIQAISASGKVCEYHC